jgi:hypothetical protein
MFKKGNTTRPWKKASVKKRFFVLQGSTLQYYENPNSVLTNGSPKNTILLESVRTLRYTIDKTAPPLAMDVEVMLPSGGTRVFTLSPAGEDWTQSSWGAVIRERVPQSAVDENFKEGTKAVDAHLKKQKKLKEAGDTPPGVSRTLVDVDGSSSRSSSPSNVKRSSARASNTIDGRGSGTSQASGRGSDTNGKKSSSMRSGMTNSLQRLSMRVMRPSKRPSGGASGAAAHNWILSKPVIDGLSDDDDYDDDENGAPSVGRRSTLSRRDRASLKAMDLPPGALAGLDLDDEDCDDLVDMADGDELGDMHTFGTHTVSRSRVLSTDEVATQYR